MVLSPTYKQHYLVNISHVATATGSGKAHAAQQQQQQVWPLYPCTCLASAEAACGRQLLQKQRVQVRLSTGLCGTPPCVCGSRDASLQGTTATACKYDGLRAKYVPFDSMDQVL